MKKESFADKMARKSFESAQIQQSWNVHMQAFGPILEPAFEENYQAKVHLTAALNFISNRNFSKGWSKLQEVQKFCETDEDKSACLFFMGLCCEMAGDREQMLQLYEYANEYEHEFYLPYMKVAKFYHERCVYDVAQINYCSAIECFNNQEVDEQKKIILCSAYVNMASCLTMMHCYDEAQDALDESYAISSNSLDRLAVEAVLYAACNDEELAKKCLTKLKAEKPILYDNVQKTVESILDKSNPMFFPVQVDEENVKGFWIWFAVYSDELRNRLDKEEFEEGLEPIAEALLKTFPFMEEPPYIALGENENGYVIELRDMYIVAVMDAYEKLMNSCPETVKEQWQFAVLH